MIPVESVIQKLVNEFEFVVIPGFGALLSRQVPAFYDKNSGVFAPPSKRLAFNEYVKLDDGLLANYISRHEKVSHTDALTYINGYTGALRENLDKSGVARIEGIGSFVSNDEGKLVFEPGSENYFKDDWYGFHKIGVKPFEPHTFAKPTLTTEDTEVVYLDSENELEVSGKGNWGRWAAAAVVSGLLVYFSFFLVTGNAENKSNLNPFSYFHSSKKQEVVAVKADAPKVQAAPVVVKEEVVKPDSISSTPAEAKPVEDAVGVEPTKASDISGKKYFLIAGAFKGSRQAGVLLEEMKIKGYPNAILIPADEFSKKVKVAVEGFNKEEDAYAASSQLKSVIGEKGWVYHKK